MSQPFDPVSVTVGVAPAGAVLEAKSSQRLPYQKLGTKLSSEDMTHRFRLLAPMAGWWSSRSLPVAVAGYISIVNWSIRTTDV